MACVTASRLILINCIIWKNLYDWYHIVRIILSSAEKDHVLLQNFQCSLACAMESVTCVPKSKWLEFHHS